MTTKEQAVADNKTRIEIAKLIDETSKINNGNRWYPLIVGSTATLAIIAILRIFL